MPPGREKTAEIPCAPHYADGSRFWRKMMQPCAAPGAHCPFFAWTWTVPPGCRQSLPPWDADRPRCGGGEQALRMSRRKWLERLGVSSLTAELLAFWKRNAHRMAPDPGGVMGADYKSCADWARALWEINPASCERLLAQWSVVHQRRRNLWRALRTKGLPIPGKIGGHDLPSSRSRV